MRNVNIEVIIGGVIAVVMIAIGLPIMITNLVAAENTTGAPTDFTSALTLSYVLLGIAPAAIIIAVFIRKFRGR